MLGQLGLRIANTLMFVGSCFLAANGVNQVSEAALAPTGTGPSRAASSLTAEPRSWSDRKAILDRNLFDVQVAGGEPIIEVDEIAEDLADTKLPLKLLGTIASADQVIASASIENTRDRAHETVRVGDKLKSNSSVEVERIGRGHVILMNGAKREVLKLSEELEVPAAATKKRASRRPSRNRARREASTADPQDRLRELAKSRGAAAIFSQARILPRYEDGQMVGIQVSKIEAGSLFEEVGLKDGDTITAVNGEPIDNPSASKNLLDALRRGESITPTVEDASGGSRDLEIPADLFLRKMDELEAEG